MTEPTNKQRAERAYRTLLAYYINPGVSDDVETALADFLTDIQHEFDQNRNPADFERAIINARRNFDAEVGAA